VQSIRDKDQFLIPFIEAIMDPELPHGHATETDQTLLKILDRVCLLDGRSVLLRRFHPDSWHWVGRTR